MEAIPANEERFNGKIAGDFRFPVALRDLLDSPPTELGRRDIAAVNLICAIGLPGSEGLNIFKCLTTLDAWTKAVAKYTRDARGDYQVRPEDFNRHRGYFNFICMVTVLKHPRGVGVQYQPSAIGNYNFLDSRDDFLHGLLTRKLGTCASLPVLFVAIGRRLGYPMRLATSNGHVYCQWLDQDGNHINLEGSCPGGGETYPDEHYLNFPNRLTPAHLATGRFLRPLTPPEELSLFLEARAHCLADNGKFAMARASYLMAERVAPAWSTARFHLSRLQPRELQSRR